MKLPENFFKPEISLKFIALGLTTLWALIIFLLFGKGG